MFGLCRLAKHMQEKHPGATHFGDSMIRSGNGEILSHKCFLCGEELAGGEPSKVLRIDTNADGEEIRA